jgi:hypothetical protein
MTTLGPLKAAVEEAEKKLTEAKIRLDAADHESEVLTAGLARLSAEREALLRRDASGEDVTNELANNRDFAVAGQQEIDDIETKRPFLREYIAEAEGNLDAATHTLKLEQSKRVRTQVMTRWDVLREHETAFLHLWMQLRDEVDEYAELGGLDIGWLRMQNAELYAALTHLPASDEAYKLVATSRSKQSIEPAGTVIPQPNQQFNRSATYLRDGLWLKIRIPAETNEQQTAAA